MNDVARNEVDVIIPQPECYIQVEVRFLPVAAKFYQHVHLWPFSFLTAPLPFLIPLIQDSNSCISDAKLNLYMQ